MPRKKAIALGAFSGAILGGVGAWEGYRLMENDHALAQLITHSKYGGMIGTRLGLTAGPLGAIIGGLAGVILAGVAFSGLILYATRQKRIQNANNRIVNIVNNDNQQNQPLIGDENGNHGNGVIPAQPSSTNVLSVSRNLTLPRPDSSAPVDVLVHHPRNDAVAASLSTDLSDFSLPQHDDDEKKDVNDESSVKDTWSASFRFRSRAYTLSESIDDDIIDGRRVRLECGHEYDIQDVDTGSDYLVTCTNCGQQSHVMREDGGGAISYRFVYQCT